MKCAICEVRTARRYCPGIRGEICTICCGTERENTVHCPLDCAYLRVARAREKPKELAAAGAAIPFSGIRVPPRFLRENARVARLVGDAVLEAVFATAGAVDHDVREALEALIRTHQTLQSGLVYETRPSNPVAANICQLVQSQIAEQRKQVASNTGVSVRDADVMAMLLILLRQEYRYNNGRRRGRAYIERLCEFFPRRAAKMNPGASPLIV